jgi:hypothetical protein
VHRLGLDLTHSFSLTLALPLWPEYYQVSLLPLQNRAMAPRPPGANPAPGRRSLSQSRGTIVTSS